MKLSKIKQLIKEELENLNEAQKMCKCDGPPKFHCAPKKTASGRMGCGCCKRLIDFVNQHVGNPIPGMGVVPEAEIQGCEIRNNGSCKGSCPQDKPCKIQHWRGVGGYGPARTKGDGDEVKFCSC